MAIQCFPHFPWAISLMSSTLGSPEVQLKKACLSSCPYRTSQWLGILLHVLPHARGASLVTLLNEIVAVPGHSPSRA